jgi:hypothetical protein
MVKKILLWGIGSIIAVLVVLVVVVAMQPSEFQVTRAAVISAAPDKVFAQVNDFHNWKAWSPWEKVDPNITESFSGTTAGAGSAYSWSGNDEVGEGKMAIAESSPNQHIKINLDFIRPFESKNVTEFTFKPDGNGTAVTWTMTGKKNFISKAACMVMDMDKMVGGDFEKGLSQMKTLVESTAASN